MKLQVRKERTMTLPSELYHPIWLAFERPIKDLLKKEFGDWFGAWLFVNTGITLVHTDVHTYDIQDLVKTY
jgi:hypothetical protein